MNELGDWLALAGPWLLRNSAEAAVLALIVLALQSLLGRWLTPGARHALWLIVAIRVLLPVLPASSWSIFNWLPQLPPGARPHQVQTPAVPGTEPDAALPAGAHAAPEAAPAVVPGAMPARDDTPAAQRWLLLGLLWLLGAGAMLGKVLWSTRALARQLRQARMLQEPRLLAMLGECQQQIGIRAHVQLYEVAELAAPALTGVWRPRLLLPRSLVRELSPTDLRFVLLHELAHLRREDLLTNWLATLLLTVHWFNPVLWLAAWRCRVDSELACDARVLLATAPAARRDYGHAIVRLVERLSHPPLRLTAAVGILDDPPFLHRRIRMIANFDARRSRFSPVLLAAMTVLLALTTLTTARSPDAPVAAPQPSDIAALSASSALTAPGLVTAPAADEPVVAPVELGKSSSVLKAGGNLAAFPVGIAFAQKVNGMPQVSVVVTYLIPDPGAASPDAIAGEEEVARGRLKVGENSMNLSKLREGRYHLRFSASHGFVGCARTVQIKDGHASEAWDGSPRLDIVFSRAKRVRLRYVMNVKHERALIGENTETAVVTLDEKNDRLRDYLPAWCLEQKGERVYVRFFVHNGTDGWGFARAPAGAGFEEMTQAPADDRYRLTEIDLEPGVVFFVHDMGYYDKRPMYGKVLVESIEGGAAEQ